MSSQSEPALPVSKQDGHNIKSGAIDCQIHVAILVEIAGHEQLRRDDAAGSMVSQSRWQKCRGKDEASQRCEWYLFHNSLLLLLNLQSNQSKDGFAISLSGELDPDCAAEDFHGIGESTDVVDDTVKFPCPSPSSTVTVPSVLFVTARSR